MQLTDNTPHMCASTNASTSIYAQLERLYEVEKRCTLYPLIQTSNLGFLKNKLLVLIGAKLCELSISDNAFMALAKAAWNTEDEDFIESKWNTTPSNVLCTELEVGVKKAQLALLLKNQGTIHEEIYGIVPATYTFHQQPVFREELLKALSNTGLFCVAESTFFRAENGSFRECFEFIPKSGMRLEKKMTFIYGLNNGESVYSLFFQRTIGQALQEPEYIIPKLNWSPVSTETISQFSAMVAMACEKFQEESELAVNNAVSRHLHMRELKEFVERLRVSDSIKNGLEAVLEQEISVEGRNEFALIRALFRKANTATQEEKFYSFLLNFGGTELMKKNLRDILEEPVCLISEDYEFDGSPSLLGPKRS